MIDRRVDRAIDEALARAQFRTSEISDIGVKRGGEVIIEVRRDTALQNVSYPRVAFEGLEPKVPNAAGKASRSHIGELLRIVSWRDKDVMVQFVFIGPEIEKDEVGGAPIVNTEEAEMVMAQIGRH